MLIRFVVENFLSFKDRTEFYMSAGSTLRHRSHVVTEQGQRILKGSFLFGANAGGKSNFLKAVQFARDIVRSDTGLKNIDCDNKHFRVDSAYKTKPGVFQFDFTTDGKMYSYGFAVSYTAASVEEEWLYRIDGDKETCIFERERADDNRAFEIKSQYPFKDEKNEARFDFMKELFTGPDPKKKQILFLTDVVTNSPEGEEDFQPFREAANWFSSVFVVYPDSVSNILALLDEEKNRAFFSSYLTCCDTGIEDVIKREINLDDYIANSENQNFKKIMGELDKGFQNPYMTSVSLGYGDNDRIEIVKKQDALYATDVMMNHGNQEDLFHLSDESDGTRRLIDLFPVYLETLKENRVFFVDELDRSLHTKAVQEFIRMFYELTEGKASQLIATAHDSNLLDLDLLRQDEIWFVDRQRDHSSRLYSLNEFRSKFERNVGQEYLLGRYGALPVFRHSVLSEMEEENADSDSEGGEENG